ncbi:fungal Zn, 2-cys(6) binuclear cluster domain protein [Rhizoctonia solani AG-3 Rhs1AP]|uniref:Fungal Zn, 2-cys(6) binuclear cluster domain protein n=1 Tax=Rhizoctonia solani AG-3 Rhs1AP TaxID=1086054 RepID=X8JFG1_9AGAM|nr:fungal Zn, 2-cys(6) binuclear cluster domain protein [Rhizoctonia solani AG-3 Rhs1AP]
MSASEKDLNNISPSHTGSNVAGNASGSGGPVGNHDVSGTYFGHLHYPHQVNSTGATSSKPSSQSQKPPPQKSAVNSPSTPGQKPKQTPRPSANQPTTVKPSATTNAPIQPPKNAPAPTPPGSAAVMAAVMAQAQAAAGQAIAAQQANKQPQQPQPQQPQQPPAPAQPPAAQHPPPIPAHHPQAYPYPYPYYLPPGQPGAPPYLYPGAPGAPAFISAGAPGQGGPPPGYPYMYPMYPAPIPVPQASPAPVIKEKKSQRTYQACQKCRQWKAKCNGLKPCNHCQKRGVPCEYAERRNMTGPNEPNNGEQSGSHEESSQPPREDAKPGDTTAAAVDPSALNNAQPQTGPPVTSNPPPPPPPAASHHPVQAPTQAPPPTAGSPPHPTQAAQPPPPMAMYPPPPPGYAYPPQLYPGMPFPAPAPDPNTPYAHFVGMQYAQPYGPYMWAAPPPPPGHEAAPTAHVGEQEEGERDADGKLKIKRTFQACQKCRQRKAKCNGVRPSCQNCASRGYTCEYAKERSKPRGTNGEEGEEALDSQGTEVPTTMDPSQAMVSTTASPVNHHQAAPGAPPIPTAAPPNMFPPPPFPYDPNAYNPHVDPHQHGGQPMYAFPPYGYGHPHGFGSIAGPPLVHIGEEGSVPPYHTAVPPPAVLHGPPPSNSPTSGSSKRPRTVRPPGTPGTGKARIFQACERCRERKAKCDGVRPICTHCAARDLNCEWAGKRRMRGPAKGITPRRNRADSEYASSQNADVNMGMPGIPLGLNTAGLQQIEPHTSTNSSARKRKRRTSHSSGSPSPSESSSSSESSPSESDDDDADRNSSMGMGPGAVSTGWA